MAEVEGASYILVVFFKTRYAAKDKRTLQAHHITHVLNAADGKFNVNTGPSFYRDTKITYYGVEAFDMASFNLRPFFYPAAQFIRNALSSPTGEEFIALKKRPSKWKIKHHIMLTCPVVISS